MVMLGVHVGAREDDADPIDEAKRSGADGVQIFLADPQGWKAPQPHPLAAELLAADLEIFVHAAAAAALGAKGMIVHGGHVTADADPAVGVDNWRKVFARQAEDGGFPLPILIENTAGGDKAMARHLEAIGKLWDAVGEFGPGFVLDTCHAWASGIDLATAVDQIKAITGRVDLVHCNNSRDEFGS